jgi:uncharacterized protein (DUF2147 family)
MRKLVLVALLGALASAASAQSSSVMGTWLTASGIAQVRIGPFEDGHIYNGENGKTYNANISLQPDGKLRLRGYVGTPMFGETQLWTRVN